MSDRASGTSETIVPFPNGGDPDPLDRAGNAVLGLLHRAAGLAEENSQQAVAIAHKLSLQLRGAEDRIKELEAAVWHHKDRADRAEKWLRQISVEIEQRFFASADGRSNPAPNPTRQASPMDYARRSKSSL